MLLRFPKEDIARSGGSIRDWGITVTYIYPTKAGVKSR
jgi:hypothetical protein